MLDLTKADLCEWLLLHGIDPTLVPAHESIIIGSGELDNVCMRVRMCVTDDDGNRMIDKARNEMMTEERVVKLKSLPAQVVSQETVFDAL